MLASVSVARNRGPSRGSLKWIGSASGIAPRASASAVSLRSSVPPREASVSSELSRSIRHLEPKALMFNMSPTVRLAELFQPFAEPLASQTIAGPILQAKVFQSQETGRLGKVPLLDDPIASADVHPGDDRLRQAVDNLRGHQLPDLFVQVAELLAFQRRALDQVAGRGNREDLVERLGGQAVARPGITAGEPVGLDRGGPPGLDPPVGLGVVGHVLQAGQQVDQALDPESPQSEDALDRGLAKVLGPLKHPGGDEAIERADFQFEIRQP